MKLDHSTGAEDIPTENWVPGSLPLVVPQWVKDEWQEETEFENLHCYTPNEYDAAWFFRYADDDFDSPEPFPSLQFDDNMLDIGKHDLYTEDTDEDL